MSGDRFNAAWLETHRVDVTGVSEADVVGIAHVMAEVRSLVGRLSRPDLLAEIGGSIQGSNVLLWGAPGTGKTLTAKLIASMVGRLSRPVTFYEVSCDELGPERLRGLFRHLRASTSADAPAIVYLDEIDLIGANRSSRLQDPEGRKALTALLAGLDGLHGAGDVVVIASTNAHPSSLDPALVRPLRLGQHIHVSRPDAADIEALWRHYAGKVRVEGDLDHADLARRSEGDTPAAIRGYVEDAVGLALAAGRTSVTPGDIDAALARAGRIEAPQPVPEIPRQVARHEAGHVCVAAVLRGPAWVARVHVAASGGVTDLASVDGLALTEDELLDAVAVAYGGGAADRTSSDGPALGTAPDIARATELLLRLIDAGLDRGLPPIGLDTLDTLVSSELRSAVSGSVGAAARVARARAEAIVAVNDAAIERFADALLAARTLEDTALLDAIADARFRAPEGADGQLDPLGSPGYEPVPAITSSRQL